MMNKISRTIFILLTVFTAAVMMYSCSGSDEQNARVSETFGLDTELFEFRDTRWGMSSTDVRLAERRPPDKESENLLQYNGDYNGMIAIIGYMFQDDKLVRAAYLINEQYEDPSYYLKDYETVDEYLTKEYGEPFSAKQEQWTDESKKEQYSSDAEAICAGDLAYSTEWLLDRTLIRHTLTGTDGNCYNGIMFESRELYSEPRKNKLMEKMPEQATPRLSVQPEVPLEFQ